MTFVVCLNYVSLSVMNEQVGICIVDNYDASEGRKKFGISGKLKCKHELIIFNLEN